MADEKRRGGRPPIYLVERLTQIDSRLQGIEQVLSGYDGKNGLLKQVSHNTRAINKLWLALIAIVASGGGGTYAIIKMVLGS